MHLRERHSFAPSRRSLAGLLAASAVMAPIASVAAAAVEPDADLIALGRELEAAWTVERETFARVADAEGKDVEDLIEAVTGRSSAIVSRIEALPATTPAGLRVKVQGLLWTHNGETHDFGVSDLFGDGRSSTDLRLIASILRDLFAMQGAAA